MLWEEKAVFARKEKDETEKKRNKKLKTSNALYADHAKIPFSSFYLSFAKTKTKNDDD